MIEWTAVVWARGTAFPRQKRKGNAVLPRSPTIWPLIVGKNWRRRWTSRTQAGRVEHWYAGLVLLNNHPSQHIRQSAPMPLPLISSRLLKHRTTRSSNARFVCRAELFCSRCHTTVFLIYSLKRRFQQLCRRRNQRQPQVTTTSMWRKRKWIYIVVTLAYLTLNHFTRLRLRSSNCSILRQYRL